MQYIDIDDGSGVRPIESQIDILRNPTTIQTFTSYTSGPDVCQCLVVQARIGNMLKEISHTR